MVIARQTPKAVWRELKILANNEVLAADRMV
jgi:hypothetical protein